MHNRNRAVGRLRWIAIVIMLVVMSLCSSVPCVLNEKPGGEEEARHAARHVYLVFTFHFSADISHRRTHTQTTWICTYRKETRSKSKVHVPRTTRYHEHPHQNHPQTQGQRLGSCR